MVLSHLGRSHLQLVPKRFLAGTYHKISYRYVPYLKSDHGAVPCTLFHTVNILQLWHARTSLERVKSLQLSRD